MQEIGATGLLEWTWGWGWWWTVDSVVAWAGISVDNTDPANPIVTNIATWGSPAGADTEIQYNDAWAFWASSDFTYDDANKKFLVLSAGNSLLLVNGTTWEYGIGDIDGIGNSTRLVIDDSIKTASIAAGWDRMRLDIDGTGFTGKLWDSNSIGNDTLITVDDVNQQIILSAIAPWNISTSLTVNATSLAFNTTATTWDFVSFNATPSAGTLTCTDWISSNSFAVRAWNSSSFISSFVDATTASAFLKATASAAEMTFYDGTTITNWVIVNGTNLRIGNYDGSGNSTLITVNDTTQRITVNKPFGLQWYTVATLPTWFTGATAYVTDALAPAFGATVVWGWAVVMKVRYDGSNWIVW